jgi:hypothetical protein
MTTVKLPTFDLETSRDMLDKLYREIDRVLAAEQIQDAADHCFNAAITAWHLHEWVWKDIRQDWHVRARLAKMAGVRPPKFKGRRWKAFILSQQTGCPALRYCRIIATASKHGGIKLIEGDPEPFEARGSPAIEARWKIHTGGKVQLAAMVFEQAFAYWNGLIRDLQIADSALGRLDETASMPQQR